MSKKVSEYSTRTLKRMATRQLKLVWRSERAWKDLPFAYADMLAKQVDWLKTIRTELTRRGERV